MVSVHCSPDDQTLWALDSRWNVHVRAGITEEMPVGTDWEHVPGSGAGQAAATRGLSDRRQQASAPILPGWGPHQQSTASQSLGFIAGRSFPDRQGLWSDAHSRIFPADGASFPGAPALCRRGLGGRRLSGRVSPSLLHPGSENRRTPRLPAGLQACQLALSARTVWARCPNGDLARRYGVSDKNPAGDYWKKIPGNVTCVTGRCWVPGTVGGAGGSQGAAPTRLVLPNTTHPRVMPDGRPAPTLPGSSARWKAEEATAQVEGCPGPHLGNASGGGAPAGE